MGLAIAVDPVTPCSVVLLIARENAVALHSNQPD
jgi:hypothetical protein